MQLLWLLLFFIFSELGAVPLLMSRSSTLVMLDESTPGNETSLTPTIDRAIAVDFHYGRQEIYFSDGVGRIYRTSLRPQNGLNKPLVIIEGRLMDGLAVDWVHNSLYWTDVTRQTVEVSDLDGLYRRTLFDSSYGVQKPRAIVVDPFQGLLFWSDWGLPKIESSGLDGKQKQTVTASRLMWPNGLALDLEKKTLYILDGYMSTISSCSYDGSNMRLLAQSHDHLQQAFALTFYANKVYWTSWRARTLYSMNIYSKGVEVLVTNPGIKGIVQRMMGVKAVHNSLQKKSTYTDPCSLADCSHRCLIGRDQTASCICPYGFNLNPDGKTCSEEGYLLLSWRKTIWRYSLNGTNGQPLNDDIKAAISLAYHFKKGFVFWSDVEEHRIYRAPLGQLNNKTMIASPETCDGLAVDWVHDVLYWTDTDRNTLEAAMLDGSHHTVLFSSDLDQPRDIAVDPFSGLMFWSDWGVKAKIERSSLDGQDRTTIVDKNVAWPNGLTIDLDQEQIYWVDGKLGTLSTCSYNGSNQAVLFDNLLLFSHPFSLTMFRDTVYWTDWSNQTLIKSKKTNLKLVERLASSSLVTLRPNGVKVVHSELQKEMDNPCAKKHCQTLCLGTVNHTARCFGEEEVDPDIDIRIGTVGSKEEKETEKAKPECERFELLCDEKQDCEDGRDEGTDYCAAIENVIVHQKNSKEIYLRIKVTNETKNKLQKFNVSYYDGKVEATSERPATPCLVWPESYCFSLSGLDSNVKYEIHVAAVIKGGASGKQYEVSTVTKEGAPGAPEEIHVSSYTQDSAVIQWLQPTESNGIIRNFIINIQEIETFEEDKCCKSFPIRENPVQEEAIHEIEITGLLPASTYAVSITSKTKYVGGSASIDINTPPPHNKILRQPNVQVPSLQPLAWQPVKEYNQELPEFFPLIKFYLLLLLPVKVDQHVDRNSSFESLYPVLTEHFGDGFSVIWHKNKEDPETDLPIQVTGLTARHQYQLAWVQVSQYKDVYSIDYITSEIFIALSDKDKM